MSKQHYDESYGLKAPENYEQFFVPVIGEPLAKDLLKHASLHPGERILDVACGTGIVARLAAGLVGENGSVTGLDINPGMLAVASSITNTDIPIEWHEASAEKIPLPSESFDVVICQLSLQFMEDKSAALKEMRRVLVPEGRICINVPGRTGELFRIFIEELNKNISPEAAGFASQVFSLYDADELRQLLEDAGFQNKYVVEKKKPFKLPSSKDFLWQYIHSTPLAGIIMGAEEAAQHALERNIVQRWQKFEHNGAMTYQQKIITATARK